MTGNEDESKEDSSMFGDLQLLKRIMQALAGRVTSMGPAELCMVAWALAVGDLKH